MLTEIKSIQKTITHTNEWLSDLMETYDYKDESQAFTLLKGTLKALRDRITTAEAVHLGTQLPALLRGFYYEGWNMNRSPSTYRNSDAFLYAVNQHLGGTDKIDLEMAVPEALNVIFRHIDDGEAEHVKHNLPKEVQELWT